MDYLEFIARVTSHIPDKGQVTVRYFGGNGLDVKAKFKSFLRCPSFVMLPPISSEDKPREVYRIPSWIDAVSLILPSCEQSCCREVPGLRQSDGRVCPHPVSRLWGGAAVDVFLQDTRILHIASCQTAGGMGRVDERGASLITLSIPMLTGER